MAWTAPKTWTLGSLLTAADMNAQVANNLSFLAAPPSWRAWRNGAWTTVASTWTNMPFDTVQYDTASGYNTGTGLYTVQVAGIYMVNAAAAIATVVNGCSFQLGFYYTPSGGAAQEWSQGFMCWWLTGNPNAPEACSNDLVQCIVGDKIEARYYCVTVAQTGYTGTTLTWFSGCKVSN